MKYRKYLAAVLAATVISCPMGYSSDESNLQICTIVSVKADTLREYDESIVKYKFMQNAKEGARKDFEKVLIREADELLASDIVSMDEYADEVQLLREKRAGLNKSEEAIVDTGSEEDALQQVLKAINELNSVAEMISLSENEVDTVASAEKAEKEALLQGERVDENYCGCVLSITGENRDVLERLVMGEAGNQGFVGAALVAQTIHDTMLRDNQYDVRTIKSSHGYAGTLDREPNENVKDAVAFIFDEGGMAVQHELRYFYAPSKVQSTFHEGCQFIVAYGGHKFFDDWRN